MQKINCQKKSKTYCQEEKNPEKEGFSSDVGKISVIVPIYNVAEYLRRCVDSILSQTYTNLEVILVDDESPDRCPEICDEYSKKDTRVKVIHKENGGLSSARNAGLKVAVGDFISFIDSDDWISPDAYEYELKLMNRFNADAVQVEYMRAHSSDIKARPSEEVLNVYKGKEILQFYMDYSTKTGSYSVWKFLYRAELCKNVFFREGKINEDIDYQYIVLSRAKVLVKSNQIKNYYFVNQISISHGGLVARDFDLYDASNALETLTRDEAYGSIAFLGKTRLARTPMSLLCKIAFYGIEDKSLNKNELIKRFTKEIKQNLGILLKSQMPFSRKVLCVCFCINYNLTEKTIQSVKKLFGNLVIK